uniref:Uncharacterized protein n=1 Tax=Meloidogyne javanica TaxID=6303 RepID=A0A915N085_MELJA
MLIITGLAGKKKYREDLANRMKHYIEKDNMNLTDLIVIHYGTDMFQILKSMDELFAEEKINEDLALREAVELKIKNVHLDIQLREEELKNKDRKDELKNKIKEIELGNEIEAKKLREVELKKKLKEEIKVEERLKNRIESLEEELKNEKSEELKKGLEEDLMKLKLEREELEKNLEQTELKKNHRKAKWRIDELISKSVPLLARQTGSGECGFIVLSFYVRVETEIMWEGADKGSDEVEILKEKSKEELRKAYKEEENLKKEMDIRVKKLREEFEEEDAERKTKGLIERLNIGGSKITEGLIKLDKGKGKSKKMLKKLKNELEKLTLTETNLKEEQNKNSEKLSRVEGILDKTKNLKKIDGNYYGLLSACCGEIEEEYEWERKLGEMEYEYEEKYPQNGIEKRLDFETVSEWKDGNKENSMGKRIDKLINKCLEFELKVFNNSRGTKELPDLGSF